MHYILGVCVLVNFIELSVDSSDFGFVFHNILVTNPVLSHERDIAIKPAGFKISSRACVDFGSGTIKAL